MRKTDQLNIVIINRSYPPFSGQTGISAAELSNFLRSKEKNIRVTAICIAENYGKVTLSEQYNENEHLIKIKTIYNGKNKLIRLFTNSYEALKMISVAKRIARKSNTTVIVMTEPPLLNIWAAICFRKKFDWGLWSMDLFPESLSAANLISNKNPIYKFLRRIVINTPPTFLISLGNFQAAFIKNSNRWSMPTFIIPCGIRMPVAKVDESPYWANEGKIVFGYLGNLGEAHSERFLVELARHLDAERHILILSVYGSKSQHLLNQIRNISAVILVEYLPSAHFHYIDVHLASLLNDFVHVCVPSKLISGVSAGAAIIFCGSKECDSWDVTKNCGWRLDQDFSIAQLTEVISDVNSRTLTIKKEFANSTTAYLIDKKNRAFIEFLQFIRSRHSCTQ